MTIAHLYDLSGRTALVTGASRGIGATTRSTASSTSTGQCLAVDGGLHGILPDVLPRME